MVNCSVREDDFTLIELKIAVGIEMMPVAFVTIGKIILIRYIWNY